MMYKNSAKYGANYARVYLASDFFEIENQKQGVFNESQVKRVDRVLELAKKYHLRVKLCFEQFRFLKDTTAPSGYQGILAVNKKSTKSSLVDNVKMLGWASNSDGGLLGDNSVIKNCFFKINDDVIKPVKNGILYKDNIVWHQMVGSVIMLGWNNTEPCAGAIVSGLDVIACDRGVVSGSDGTPQAFFNLKNTNGGTYTNILVENVRMETKPYMLFGVDIKINDKGFTNNSAFNKGLGSIDGLIFRNIFVPEAPSRISYFNGNGNVTATSSGDIKNVTFENIKIAGKVITTQNALNFISIMGNTSNFSYK